MNASRNTRGGDSRDLSGEPPRNRTSNLVIKSNEDENSGVEAKPPLADFGQKEGALLLRPVRLRPVETDNWASQLVRLFERHASFGADHRAVRVIVHVVAANKRLSFAALHLGQHLVTLFRFLAVVHEYDVARIVVGRKFICIQQVRFWLFHFAQPSKPR